MLSAWWCIEFSCMSSCVCFPFPVFMREFIQRWRHTRRVCSWCVCVSLNIHLSQTWHRCLTSVTLLQVACVGSIWLSVFYNIHTQCLVDCFCHIVNRRSSTPDGVAVKPFPLCCMSACACAQKCCSQLSSTDGSRALSRDTPSASQFTIYELSSTLIQTVLFRDAVITSVWLMVVSVAETVE